MAVPPFRLIRLLSEPKARLLPAFLFVVTRLAALIDLAYSDSTLQQLLVLDSARYEAAARRIAAGEFAFGPGSFSFAPLYAYYLALIHALGGDLPAVYASQIVVSGLGVWLLFRIGGAIFGRSRAVLSSSLWCLYGAAGMMELKVTESTLATTLSLCAVFLLLPARGLKLSRFLFAGSLLGLACLARPNTLLLLPLLALWLASGGSFRLRTRVTRERLGRVAVFVLGAGLAIAPVSLRNHFSSGGWTLISSQGGVTFAQGNNSAANGSYAALDGFSGDPAAQAGEAQRVASAAQGRPLSEAEVDRYWYERGWSFLAADPWNALLLWLKKLACWLGSDELSMEYVLAAERVVHPSLWLMPIPFGFLLAATVLGVRRGWLVGKAGLLSCLLGANVASAVVFFFASRYRIECVPALCLFAAEGACCALERPARVRLVVAVVVGALSLSSWSRAYELQQASYYYLLGNEYFKDGARATAVEYYERAVAGRPDDWAIRHNLGEAYGTIGKYGQAIEQLETALVLDPSRDSTRRALRYYRERVGRGR